MADRNSARARPAPARAAAPAAALRENDEAERRLGRTVALGLPAAGVVAAIAMGALAGIGSALLVVAATALLGTIGLLWASVRTLSGDAPLAVDFEAAGARRHGIDVLGERKRRVLRALKDLETEHAVGKIDDADYDALVAKYRDEAKVVMRQMDLEVAPLRDEAERIARAFLKKRGLSTAPVEGRTPVPEHADDSRQRCANCQTANDADAAFCKKCGSAMNASPDGSHADA